MCALISLKTEVDAIRPWWTDGESPVKSLLSHVAYNYSCLISILIRHLEHWKQTQADKLISSPTIQTKHRQNRNNLAFSNPLWSPVEAVIFNIPAAFSLQLNLALLIPKEAIHSHTERSIRWSSMLLGTHFLKNTIKPKLSYSSNSALLYVQFIVRLFTIMVCML